MLEPQKPMRVFNLHLPDDLREWLESADIGHQHTLSAKIRWVLEECRAQNKEGA